MTMIMMIMMMMIMMMMIMMMMIMMMMITIMMTMIAMVMMRMINGYDDERKKIKTSGLIDDTDDDNKDDDNKGDQYYDYEDEDNDTFSLIIARIGIRKELCRLCVTNSKSTEEIK